MTTATERRSRRLPRVQNGRFYATLITIIIVVSTVCNTITEVMAR